MRLGALVSIAGGLFQAFARGQEVGCETIMIFTKSNRQWRARPITTEDLALFHKTASEHKQMVPVSVHASYLINLASADPALWERSKEALKVELLRAIALGVETVTFHPGSAVDGDVEAALKRVGKGIKEVLEETEKENADTLLCLETMAGQGSQLGHQFEQLAAMIEYAGSSEKIGVCLDTCHVFAAGYDIRTQAGYQQVMQAFDRSVGLERIKCFHLNDSVHPLGSRKDRHAHIGEGKIGLEGFTALLNDPMWKEHSGYLETPKNRKIVQASKTPKKKKTTKGEDMDPVNLRVLRSLLFEPVA